METFGIDFLRLMPPPPPVCALVYFPNNLFAFRYRRAHELHIFQVYDVSLSVLFYFFV